MNKIKIKILADDASGCFLHRLFFPYLAFSRQYDKEVEIDFGLKAQNIDDAVNQLIKYDVIIFHKIIDKNCEIIEKLQNVENKPIIIDDIDDYWVLPDNHPSKYNYKKYNLAEKFITHLKLSDYIFTTTKYLGEKIQKYNKNVLICPNCLKSDYLDDIEQLKPNKTKSNLIRIGLNGGASHFEDLQLIKGLSKNLPDDILKKIQFVLCGFDESITYIYDEFGNFEKKEKTEWENNEWVKLEKEISDNYKLCSKEYAEYLQLYNKQLEYPNNYELEHYRRIWTKNIYTYLTNYNDIDILLVPLKKNDFNSRKSELKLVECGSMGCACVVSDCFPYKQISKNILKKGGGIDETGNCICVDESKKLKGWISAITKIVNNPELIEMMKNNLKKDIDENYNLDFFNEKRFEIIIKLIDKKNEKNRIKQ